MNKRKLYGIGLLTLLGFPLVGITIVGIVEDNPFKFTFGWKDNWLPALLAGLAYGLFAGWVAWLIINTRFMAPVKQKYGHLIALFRMKLPDILFLSLAAGIGEEFLFRGVLQAYFGIWITAVVFVAIHGYLNPMDKRITAYGIFMTLTIAGMGYLTEHLGILSAMAAHFVIDLILFYKLSKLKKTIVIPPPVFPEQPDEMATPPDENK